MKLNLLQYSKMLADKDIHVIYVGPLWANGIDGLAEMLIKRLEFDDISFSASQSIFSVFVEQINNMMMYSAEKELKNCSEGESYEISRGILVLGVQGSDYFMQSGNLVTNANAAVLKDRIDHLNSLDKSELRKYHKERTIKENENVESKGAGLGLIVVARRSSSPIEYKFEPYDNEHQFFSMYITIHQGGQE